MIAEALEPVVKPASRVPLFTPEQQGAFDRAFKKREAKIRRESEHMRRDLLDTAGLTMQLLDRCRDRIGIEEQRVISEGLAAIRREYGDK